MPSHCSKTCGYPSNLTTKMFGHQHGKQALGQITQQGEGCDFLVSGSQHIGCADIARTNGPNITSHALNRFSIDSGSVRAELQGFSLWTISRRLVNGVDTSGTGIFRSSVNGRG